VVPHEDVCIEMKGITGLVGCQDLEKLLIVGRVFEDLLALIAAGDDMIECSLVFNAGLSGHARKIAEEGNRVNMSISKSDPIRFPFFSTDYQGTLIQLERNVMLRRCFLRRMTFYRSEENLYGPVVLGPDAIVVYNLRPERNLSGLLRSKWHESSRDANTPHLASGKLSCLAGPQRNGEAILRGRQIDTQK